MKYFLSSIITLLIFPFFANANVSITEIAWMGTEESQYSEWIELYNDSSQTIDLTGWKLYEANGDTTIFTFSKSIPAKGLILLERTTASAPDPIPGINDESGTFGGSGLSNSGEFLVLKDNNGNIEQSLNFSDGWPAGDSDSRDTMQWNGSVWVTATPTPKVLNNGIAPSTSSNEEDDNSTSTASSNGGGKVEIAPYNKPHIEFVVPKFIYSDVPNDYKATVVLEYMNPTRGIFIWNLGDGTTFRQTELLPITHTYNYPGKYTLSFAYFRNEYDTKPYISENVSFDVIKPTIEVSVFDGGNALEIKNPTDKKLDLTNWKISGFGFEGVFPDMTIIAPRATIIIPAQVFNVHNISNGNIIAPNGQIVTSFGVNKNTTKIIKSSNVVSSNFVALTKANAIESINDEPSSNIVFAEDQSEKSDQKQNHTKYIIFGVVSLITIGLSILLERFMAQQE